MEEALYGPLPHYCCKIANADDLCYFNNYNNGESRLTGTNWQRRYDGHHYDARRSLITGYCY